MSYAFGEVDLIGVIDFPTPEDAAAFGIAVGSSGALRLYRTTQLLTIDQGIASLHQAEEVRKVYSPPLTGSLVGSPQPLADEWPNHAASSHQAGLSAPQR